MSIVKRYFEVIGEGIEKLESLAQRRKQEIAAGRELGQEYGFEGAAIASGIGGDRISGFVMAEGQEPDVKAWKLVSRVEDRCVYRPKRTSKARRELDDRIDSMRITDRHDMLDLFGLKGWEAAEPVGHSLRVVSASCGQLAGRWVVVVPEKEWDDAAEPAQTFDGHEWLRELTLADFRELQAEHERAKEAA